MWERERDRKRHPTSTFGPFWHISKSHKNFNIEDFDTRIFLICSSLPSEAIEVLKIEIYAWEPLKKMMKNDENGQLSFLIYSSPAAARSPLQGWVGDRCRDRSI